MKRTGYFLIHFLIISAFISSCSKDDLLPENSGSNLNSGKKSGSKAGSFFKEDLPLLKFISSGDDKNIYTLLLKDPTQTTTVNINGRIRYQDQSQARISKALNEVTFSIEGFKTIGKAPDLAFPAPPENQILDVSLEYSDGYGIVKKLEYSLFVFADGTTALQKPEIRISEKGFVGRWTFDDGRGVDYSKPTYSIIVENDPAEVVAAVEVLFDEKTASPEKNYLKRKAKFGQCWVFSGAIQFTGNPVGVSYAIQVSLLDERGQAVNQPEEPLTFYTAPIRGKEGARIHAIRIKENNDGSDKLTYEIAALVLDIKQERIGYVEVVFNEPFTGPKPLNNTVRLRKRPEILFQEWDNLLDANLITEIQNNPLFNGEHGTQVNPLFEKSAVGHTYNVSASIFDKNGKQIGKTQTFNVSVEGETSKAEPVVQSARLFSSDGGKTSTFEVVIQDNDQWVEDLTVEFVKPFDGPAPVNGLISLSLVGKKEGNLKFFSGKVEFEMGADPAGFFYKTVFYAGTGGGYGDTVVARAPAGVTHEYH